MSYQSRRPSRMMVPRASLGSLVDEGADAFFDLFSRDEECEQEDPQVTAIVKQAQAQIDDLANNWNPTGFYTPNQLAQAIAFTLQLTNTTRAAIIEATSNLQLPRHIDMLIAAQNEMDKSIGVGGLGTDPLGPFDAAVQQARAQGADAVHAEGFKRTVLNVMRATRDAAKTVAVVGCARPWIVSVMQSVSSAFVTLYNFLRAVGGVIKDVVKKVAEVPDMIGTVFTVLKWTVLLGGSYFVGVKTGLLPEKFDPLNLRK